MRARLLAPLAVFISGLAGVASAAIPPDGERTLNNVVSELLTVSSVSKPSRSFTFTRSSDGWIFISATCKGMGTIRLALDQEKDTVIAHDGAGGSEAMRYAARGAHTLHVEWTDEVGVEEVAVKAIHLLFDGGVGVNQGVKLVGLYEVKVLEV